MGVFFFFSARACQQLCECQIRVWVQKRTKPPSSWQRFWRANYSADAKGKKFLQDLCLWIFWKVNINMGTLGLLCVAKFNMQSMIFLFQERVHPPNKL